VINQYLEIQIWDCLHGYRMTKPEKYVEPCRRKHVTALIQNDGQIYSFTRENIHELLCCTCAIGLSKCLQGMKYHKLCRIIFIFLIVHLCVCVCVSKKNLKFENIKQQKCIFPLEITVEMFT